MPPRYRRYGRRRGRFRRRKGRMTRYNRPSYSFARKVRRVVSAELKFSTNTNNDTLLQDAVAISTPVVNNITTGIAVGTSATQRVGNYVDPVNIHGTISLEGNATSATPTYKARIIFLAWTDEFLSGVSPQLGDILETPTDPWSMFDTSAKGRFKSLYSRKVLLVNDETNPKFSMTFNYHVKMGKIPNLSYQGATALRNHVMLFVLADNDGVNFGTFNLSNMFRYTDS